MNELKEEQLSKKEEAEKVSQIVLINSPEALVSFLIEILEIDAGEEINVKDLNKNNSFRVLYKLLENISCLTIAIEHKYVEKVYRDSYYMHYSCKHQNYDRYCKRLFLFNGNIMQDGVFPDYDIKFLQKEFIGTISIRPIAERKIGRSLINPYFVTDREEVYLRYAKYSVTISGVRLYINAFPYSMQDCETTTCAEITILNLLDYYSQKYSEYKYLLPSDIAEITKRNGFERSLPTKGLGYSVITKVFSEAGFYPKLYRVEALREVSQFKRIMHYYIESGIPVAVGVKIDDETRHSIVCMGHGKINYQNIDKKIYGIYAQDTDEYIWLIDSADLSNDYIVMDDGQEPYAKCEWKTIKGESEFAPEKHKLGKYEPDILMVPLYRRMFLEAQDAYEICTTVLTSSKLGIKKFVPEIGNKENPVIIRLFMASARGFKKGRIGKFSHVNKEISDRYRNILFPHFVWVCELYTKEGYQKNMAMGEIVIDATASPYDVLNSILILHYPYQIVYKSLSSSDVNQKSSCSKEIFEKVHLWEEFSGYSNLNSPKLISTKFIDE